MSSAQSALSTGGSFARAMLLGHKQAVCCVAWSPDGMQVVAGSNDCTARTWKLGQLDHGPEVEMRLLQQEMAEYLERLSESDPVAYPRRRCVGYLLPAASLPAPG